MSDVASLDEFCDFMWIACEDWDLGYDQDNRWDVRDGGECDCSSLVIWALRAAGFEVVGMVAAYTYGFPIAEQAFQKAGVRLLTLTNYEAVVSVAIESGYITADQQPTLNEWRKDPANWMAGSIK